MRITLTVLFALSALIYTSASASPLDFDADNRSDFAMVDINSNGTLSWSVFPSQSLNQSSLGNLGKAGNNLIPGYWLSSSSPSIGVVSQSSADAEIIWNISGASTFALGSASDTVIAGADLDNSGIYDAIAVKRNGKSIIWSIKLDPLVQSSETQQIQFGKVGAYNFFLNPSAQGDELAWLDTSKKNTTIVRTKRLSDGKVRKFTVVANKQFKLSERPLPLRQIDGKDALVFVKRGSTKTNLYIYKLNGKKLAHASINAVGTIIVGDFDERSGHEVAIQNGASFIVFNPISKSKRNLVVSDEIPVDHININSFSSDGSDGVCTKLDLPDGNDNNVWKPKSDTQPGAVYVAKSSLTGKIKKAELFTTGGSLIKELTYKGTGNGNRSNWQDYVYTGSYYKNTYGSIVLKVTLKAGGCLSVTLTDPSKRID